MSLLLVAQMGAAELAQWRDALTAAMPHELIATERSPDVDAQTEVAIVANPLLGALQGLPALRLIQSLWAGVDKLLRDATLPAEVPLARMVDPAMNEAMAETALWAVLSLHRGFFRYAAQQREARWAQHPQTRADEIKVAVLGLGEMGRTVASRLAHQGYRVTGWSTRPAQLDGLQCVHGRDALPGLLCRSPIVINLLPLTPATTGLFNAATFAQMPAGAALVNLARGAHLVEADLLAALNSGQLGHAVLDVFGTEPLPSEHAFWHHPRVTVLPHVAAQTDPRSAAGVVAANVRALRTGQPLQHLVDRACGY